MENYEEKYKQGLEGIQEILSSGQDTITMSRLRLRLQGLFPELKESEDERIRKNCIHFLELQKQHHAATFEIEECIAWLEKQDEKKPTDKVEPKFKTGDWISNGEYLWLIEGSHNGFYDIVSVEGCKTDDTISYIDKHFRLWTIQDAKDGDVLKEDSCIFIVEKIKPDNRAIVHCCLFDDWDLDCTGSTLGFDVESTAPATKEQRNLLFQKMKEAGYEWDAEKKEFRRTIENQGGQKSDDKTEPKFKVGDWIVNSNGTVRQIIEVTKNGYRTNEGWLSRDFYENYYHLLARQNTNGNTDFCNSDNKEFIENFKNFMKGE